MKAARKKMPTISRDYQDADTPVDSAIIKTLYDLRLSLVVQHIYICIWYWLCAVEL